jgi:hypothetical protein
LVKVHEHAGGADEMVQAQGPEPLAQNPSALSYSGVRRVQPLTPVKQFITEKLSVGRQYRLASKYHGGRVHKLLGVFIDLLRISGAAGRT